MYAGERVASRRSDATFEKAIWNRRTVEQLRFGYCYVGRWFY
jgi:hypothetical protein